LKRKCPLKRVRKPGGIPEAKRAAELVQRGTGSADLRLEGQEVARVTSEVVRGKGVGVEDSI
jgi:hypothetical protein